MTEQTTAAVLLWIAVFLVLSLRSNHIARLVLKTLCQLFIPGYILLHVLLWTWERTAPMIGLY